MFQRKPLMFALLLASSLVTLAACGGMNPSEEIQTTERNEASLSTSAIPSWFRHIPLDWGCDQTLKGRFVGRDSAHLYSFPGKVGYRYTFSFKGTHPAAHGAAIAVYDSQSGKRVALQFASRNNSVSLQYTAAQSIKYLVGVFSIHPYTTGNYTLSAKCELTKYCVEYETTDEQGNPYNNFYAINVNSYAEGKKHLAIVKYFIHEAISNGSCASQGTMCPLLYDPVCTDSPTAQTEYGNVCEFKVHIRKTAGDAGQHKGHWDKGQCSAEGKFCGGIAGIQCPEGFTCVLDGNYPDAGGKCTKITCDPKKEWNRNYVTTDKNQCALIRYTCPTNTTHFSNDCGCGCEQAASCPEYFNCMPGPGAAPCDTNALLAKCPYSKIAW